MLTTRATALGRFGIAHPLTVDTFSPNQGILFLLRRAGVLAPDAVLEQALAHERTLALQITQELDGLPLALDQAGAYIEATGTSLALYQQIYQQHRAALLGERRGPAQDHPEPVATTWSLSMQRVEEKSTAAADILRLCAFLAPDAIGEELLTEGSYQLGPVLAPVAADPYLLDQAIEILRAHSLVIRDPHQRTLSVHRLVQAVLRDSLSAEARQEWMRRAVLAIAAVFPYGEFENWLLCERLLPHALQCALWIEQEQNVVPQVARLLNYIGHYLSERGRYAGVEALHQQALTILEQNEGRDEIEIASSLTYLGSFYISQGRYAEAEPLLQRALAIRERVLGPEHPDTVLSLNNLADLYKDQGKYEQSERLYEQSLAVRKRVLGEEHPDTAQSLNNLAFLYFHQSKYEQVKPLLEQALAICRRVLGEEHPTTQLIWENLVWLLQQRKPG